MFADSAEALRATIKAFGGGTKADGGDTLDFVPDFPLAIKVVAFKRNVCEQVPVTRLIPETIVPAKPACAATFEVVIPAHEETVMEYSCHPFLEGAR